MSGIPQHIPKIGALYGGPAAQVPTSWCKQLYQFYVDLAARGACTLHPLGWMTLTPGMRVSWDLQPIDVHCQSPGPLPEEVRQHGFDGLITLNIWSDRYVAAIAELGVPLVTLDFQPVGVPCDSVIFDGLSGGKHLGQLLAKTGHRQVMFVSQYSHDTTARKGAENHIEDDASVDRRLGVLSGLQGSPATLWPAFPVLSGQNRKEVPKRLERCLQAAGCMPDAVTGHDAELVAFMRPLFEALGAKIPSQISLAAFAAGPSPAGAANQISHMSYSWLEMAEAGWKLLSARMQDRSARQAPPRVERLQGRYVDRGTVCDRRGILSA